MNTLISLVNGLKAIITSVGVSKAIMLSSSVNYEDFVQRGPDLTSSFMLAINKTLKYAGMRKGSQDLVLCSHTSPVLSNRYCQQDAKIITGSLTQSFSAPQKAQLLQTAARLLCALIGLP